MKTVKQTGKSLLRSVEDAIFAYNTFAFDLWMPQIWSATVFTDANKFWKEFDPKLLMKIDGKRKFGIATPDQAEKLGLVNITGTREFPTCALENTRWEVKKQLTPGFVITQENEKEGKKIAKKMAKNSETVLNRVSVAAKKKNLIK